MKFRIKRTSNWGGEEKPCEKAYGGKHLGGRADDVRVWYIDINTLDELIALRDEVENELIVGTANEKELNDMPEIEIYDDYRE